MSHIPSELEQNVEAVLQSKTVEQAKKMMSARSGLLVVSTVSFIESALPLPLITDPFLVAAIMSDRANTVRLVIATTITSMLGGLVAYLIVLFFMDVVLGYMTPTMVSEFHSLTAMSHDNTFVLTILGAITPVPYTLVAFVVGAIKGNIWMFLLASLVGRGFRYVVVGYSTYRFGSVALSYARRYVGITSVLLFLAAVLYFWYKM